MTHKLTHRQAAALTRHTGRTHHAGDEVNEVLAWTLIDALIDVEAFKEMAAEPGTVRHNATLRTMAQRMRR